MTTCSQLGSNTLRLVVLPQGAFRFYPQSRVEIMGDQWKAVAFLGGGSNRFDLLLIQADPVADWVLTEAQITGTGLTALPDPAHFHGRRREIELIASRLQGVGFGSSSVVGERRIGKTSLLRHFLVPEVQQRYGFGPEFTFVYLSFGGLSTITPAQFWQWVLEELLPKVKDEALRSQITAFQAQDGPDFLALRRLFDAITRKGLKVVLVFDEFEDVVRNPNFDADFYGGLRDLASRYNLTLLTSSRRQLIEYSHSEEISSSPFFNIFANIVLKPFSRGEALELIAEYLEETDVVFSDEDREYNRARFPDWFATEVDLLASFSSELRKDREPSMYGDEVSGITPDELYGESQAVEALAKAERTFATCERLINEIRSEERA